MNFYIGNSLDEINIKDYNVEFSDELLYYICDMKEKVPYDMGKFYEINPYDDEEISQEDLLRFIPACKYILANSLLPDYKEQNEGYQMLSELITIAQEALQRNKGLVSIGD